MRNRNFAIALLITLISANTTIAANNYYFEPTQAQPIQNSGYVQQPLQYANNNALQGSVVMVPAGASVKAMLTAPLSSEYTTAGQTVSLALNDDFYYDDKLIAPAGSTIYGTVIESSKAKRGSINGKLCVRFTQILSSI